MVETVKRYGILQPLIVRRSKNEPGMFEVIAGSRRLSAARKAKLTEVPCIVLEKSDGLDHIAIAIITNTTARNLTLSQKLRCWKRLADKFPDMPLHAFSKHTKLPQKGQQFKGSIDEKYRRAYEVAKELADRTGISPDEAERLLPILQLPSIIRKRIDQGWIEPGMALFIASRSPNDLAALESVCRVSANKLELTTRVRAMLARMSGQVVAHKERSTVKVLQAISDYLWSEEIDESDGEMISLWHEIREVLLKLAEKKGLSFAVRVPRVPRVRQTADR